MIFKENFYLLKIWKHGVNICTKTTLYVFLKKFSCMLVLVKDSWLFSWAVLPENDQGVFGGRVEFVRTCYRSQVITVTHTKKR